MGEALKIANEMREWAKELDEALDLLIEGDHERILKAIRAIAKVKTLLGWRADRLEWEIRDFEREIEQVRRELEEMEALIDERGDEYIAIKA